MRCASCGTENAPDSRFCGGCGARVQQSQVAPTQKISDDAPYPATPAPRAASVPGAYAPQHASIPPQNAIHAVQHASIPPQNAVHTPQHASIPPQHAVHAPQHASIPPQNQPPQYASHPPRPRAQSQVAHGAEPPAPLAPTGVRARSAPSLSIAAEVPRTRWGLIIGVLVIDLGLAAAGAWMLSQGLAEDGPAPAAGPPATEKSSAAPAPAPRPAPVTAKRAPATPTAPVVATDPSTTAAEPAEPADPGAAAEAATAMTPPAPSPLAGKVEAAKVKTKRRAPARPRKPTLRPQDPYAN